MITETQPAKRMTRVPTRTKQLRTIHELARFHNLETREGRDRTAYEAELMKACGRTSSRQATRSEREAIIRHLEAKPLGKRPVEVVSDDEALDILGEAA